MNATPEPRTRSGAIAQGLHWATAIFVLIAFTYGPGGNEQRVYSAARDFQRQLHETLGMVVFMLVALRVLWMAIDRRPESPPVPRWMEIASKVVQVALYVLLFAVPLTAIAGAWLEGHPVTLLAGVEIQPLLAPAHDLGAWFANAHEWLGDAILWVAGVHALAAIGHHLILGDEVLASMLPRAVASRIPRVPREG
jgi:cytochrome b561